MSTLLQSHNAWLKNAALSLQVIGVLSAIVFVLNFSLEILLFQGLQKEHQMLMLSLLLILAGWAIFECKVLQIRQNQLQLKELFMVLIIQLIVESLRMLLAIWGMASGVDRVYGISVFHAGPLFVLLPAYMLVFLAIAKTLIAAYVSEIKTVSQTLEEANEELKRMTIIQVEQSRFQEREKLLQDMHDGFGSQLASIRIMAEQGRIKPEQLPNYLREMTSDLHLIVDTLSQEDITLESALLDMRYRMQRRFDAGKPQMHWQIQLDGMPELDPRLILHILRIMQEAFNNAFAHANSNNVWLNAHFDAAQQRLIVSVRDDGAGMPEKIRPGRGLSNMQQRSREIGAQLERMDAQPGTEIRLTLVLAKSD